MVCPVFRTLTALVPVVVKLIDVTDDCLDRSRAFAATMYSFISVAGLMFVLSLITVFLDVWAVCAPLPLTIPDVPESAFCPATI